MIPANELRTGNIVDYAHGIDCRVIGIDSTPSLCELALSPLDELIGRQIEAQFDEVEPIPLSPEILEKCGFTKGEYTGEFYLPMGALKLCLYTHGGTKFYGYLDKIYLADQIDSLHSLQNFYFTWLKRELTVNL